MFPSSFAGSNCAVKTNGAGDGFVDGELLPHAATPTNKPKLPKTAAARVMVASPP
jgi:hypothetical protein